MPSSVTLPVAWDFTAFRDQSLIKSFGLAEWAECTLLEPREIAEVLGIKPASVNADLSRIRRTLRAVIGRRRHRKVDTESSTNNAAFEGRSPA